MSRKIYAGNLSFAVTEAELSGLFSRYGTVLSVNVPEDRISGTIRGFAFIEMASEAEAAAAILALDGSEFDGRRLRVNEARESTRRPRSS